jgi:hypothetical protein
LIERKLSNNELRGIDTEVHIQDDRYPKWVIKLMQEINPKKAPKIKRPRFKSMYANNNKRKKGLRYIK